MIEIVFATSNEHKLTEVKLLLPDTIQLISLKELGFYEEIPEEEDTIEGNSFVKASCIYNTYKIPCLAEDTGLIVESLNGQPGVRSARYAGEHATSEENIALLLKSMKGIKNRNAQFETIATFIDKNSSNQYRGVVKGSIVDQKRGSYGFGYDSVFVPAGFDQTFAEMDHSTKNLVSHRRFAVNKFISYVRENYS